MKTMKYFFLLLLALGFTSTYAQGIEEEVEFKYIKANYLLDTERYDDAIKAYSDIIASNPNYKDVLLKRGEAKYQASVYRGTKNDVLQYIETNGVSAYAVELLGLATYKLNEMDAALNSLQAAATLGSQNHRALEYLGDLYKDKGQMLKACEYWQIAAKLGSSSANISAQKACGYTSTPQNNPQQDANTNPYDDDFKGSTNNPTQPRRDEDDTLSKPTKGTVLSGQDNDNSGMDDNDPIYEEPEEVVKMPPEDNTPNNIEVDEYLSLTVKGQGLGLRKILDQPQILILSDVDGIVAVEVCVNSRGKVESAQLNSAESTTSKKSLVSLAIRKSKEFWFEKNDYEEQCGIIYYNIKKN